MEQLPEYWKLIYSNSILECNTCYYWNIIPKHGNPGRQLEEMEQQGKIHGNKPRGKLDLNL